MDNKNFDFKTVHDAVLADPVSLPESLQEENIKKMLDAEKPLRVVKNKTGKRRIAAFAACAAVICLCAGGLAAVQGGFSDSQMTDPFFGTNESVQAPESEQTPSFDFLSSSVRYEDVYSLVKKYAEKQTVTYKTDSDVSKGVWNSFAGLFSTKNDAADMEIAVEDAVMNTTAAATNSNRGEAPMLPETDAAEDAVDSAAGASGTEYGKTNVQVEGVDEADIIKNDGKHLYLMRNSSLHIFSAYPADNMKEISYIVFKDCFDDELISYYSANEIFLYNNYLAVLLSTYEKDYAKQRTMVLVYDVSDPAAPVFVQRFAQDGFYLSARITNGRLVLVTNHTKFFTYDYNSNGYTCKADEENVIPRVYVGAADGVAVAENNLSIADAENPTGFTVVSLYNMDDLSQPVSSEAVLGGGTEMFCTDENLFISRVCYKTKEYVTDTARDSLMIAAESEATTEIYSFSFADGNIVPVATGSVPGRPLNQFSMDEHNGYFRIAVTLGNDNGLYVLDSNLSVVGECERYGKDEQIQSVRFLGDWAYVVTFRQTDPLFVIDLTQPTQPVLAGEVKLPGFSAYLHPIGNGLLLGIGYGGTESGLDGSAKISLFDVSDPKNPVEADFIVHSNASLSTEHKAFCTVSDGSFMIPMYKYGTKSEYGYDVWVQENGGVLHFAVEDKKIVLRNEFCCQDLYTNPQRVTYIGNVAYAVATYQSPSLYAFDMTNGNLIATAACSALSVPSDTAGWRHYLETEAETKYSDSGETIVVMTTPAYNPDAGGKVVEMTTASPISGETAVNEVQTAVAPDYVPQPDIAIEPAQPPQQTSVAQVPQTEIALWTSATEE